MLTARCQIVTVQHGKKRKDETDQDSTAPLSEQVIRSGATLNITNVM